MNLKEIEARLAVIQADIEAKGESLTAEQISAYDIEVTNLKEEKSKLIEAEQRKTLLSAIAEGRSGTVVQNFTLGNNETESDDIYATVEYRKAFMQNVLKDTPMPIEYRADALTKTSDVGAVIPTTVLNQIIEKLESSGMILPLVTHTNVKGGVEIPVSNLKPVATWVAEGGKSDKQKMEVPKNGTVSFLYYKLSCRVAVSLEVETMAIAAFENMIIRNIVEAVVKALEQAVISGSGTGQMKGILTETPATGQSIESTAPAYKDLVDAEAALPLAYENGAVWCMTKKTFMAYYGLTDTNGQPVGRVNYGISGKPERTLLGRPAVLCDYLPSYAAGLTADTVFGFLYNFADYAINTNYDMGVRKYKDEETDDTVTKALMLVDGKVLDKGSLVVIKKKA